MGPITRRAFLTAAGATGLLALIPASATAGGVFLTTTELDTLRAAAETLVPGAREAHCAEAIGALLAAFAFDPPRIHAGGPFSGRAGPAVSGDDDFRHFIALDPIAELGWRIRIEGSQGKPEREFAGPVTGLQEIYRTGLARVNQRARALGARDFASLAPALQDVVLNDPADADVQTFSGTALANTLEFMYGPPEYGGNRNLSGWRSIGWPGDAQPRGFTARQVSEPDPASGVSHAEAQAALDALRRHL